MNWGRLNYTFHFSAFFFIRLDGFNASAFWKRLFVKYSDSKEALAKVSNVPHTTPQPLPSK
jgi:hypothetical protein